MTEPLFTLDGVKKSYKGRLVLDIPELILEQGCTYALLGANGSGKTTLLRLLAGRINADQGSINCALPPDKVAYLPQKPYAFSFSALRNLTMALPADCTNKKALAQAALDEVGLGQLRETKGHRLSGGESQRLAVARLLMAPHSLLLLDEPTSATDIAGNELIEAALARYMGDNSCQLIFATHALSQAERLADQILFFAQGRICEQGPVEQVLHHSQSAECRAFLRFWRTK